MCFSTDRRSRRGRIVAVLGQLDAERVRHRVGGERARHPPAAVVALDQRRIGVEIGRRTGTCRRARSSRLAGVTSPSKWPYSSWTKAIGTSLSRSTVDRVHRVHLVGNDRRRLHQRAQVDRPRPRSGSRRCRAPGRRRSAGRPSPRRPGCGCAAASSQLPADRLADRRRRRSSRPRCAASSPRGSAGRRAGRRREMIARSLSSSTPAVAASATTRWSSSAVTWSLDSRLQPQQPEDQRAGPVEQPDRTAPSPGDSQQHRQRHRRPRSARASAARIAWAPARRSPARHRW